MISTTPDQPDRLLTREAVAQALTAAGYAVSPKTLATKATRGGGPLYCRFNGRTLYRWGDALDWARAQTSVPHCSTSEARTARQGRR